MYCIKQVRNFTFSRANGELGVSQGCGRQKIRENFGVETC
jgi:hypothetical protein